MADDRQDNFIARLRKALKGSKGQTLVEYGLLLVLIAVIIAAVILIVGQRTCTLYSQIGSSIP